jgi:uncharacterized protein
MSALEKYVRFILDHRFLTIILSLVVSGLLAWGIKDVGIAGGYKKFVSEEHPLVRAIIEIEEDYANHTNNLIMIKPPSGDVFNRDTLAAVHEVTEGAWLMPFVKRVDSLTNFQFTRVDGDMLQVGDLVEDPVNLSDQDIAYIKKVALSEVELRNHVVAGDGSATAINIEFELNESDLSELQTATLSTRELIARVESQYPDLEFYMVGMVGLQYAWKEVAAQDIVTIVPVALAVIFIGIVWFFGSFTAALATAFISLLSILTGLGALGHINGFLSTMASSGVIMIMILAVADAVHILSIAGKFLAQGLSRNDAIAKAVVTNFRAIALTSLTTAIGFLSFNASEFEGLAFLGDVIAFGVIFAFLLSVSLLPALLTFCNLKPAKERISNARYLSIAEFVIRHRAKILVMFVPIILGSIWLAQQNVLDDGMAKYLSERVKFRRDMMEVEKSLTGTATLLYNLDTETQGIVTDTEYMQQVENLADWFRQQPEVRFVNSYTDIMKRLNRDMHFGNPDQQILPESQDMAAQYLLLYEMSLPYGLDLTNKINLDKSGTLMTVVTNDLSYVEFDDLDRRVKQWTSVNMPGFDVQTSGGIYITAEIIAINFGEMFRGALLALAVIAVVLVFSLGSILAGLVCSIAVVVPILVGYGLWAVVNGTIGMSAALVMSMAIGIAVDDSVHFMSKYLHARKGDGQSRPDSVRYAFFYVGEALLANTVALGAGFMILTLSSMVLYSVMGLLNAMIIVLALLVNLLLVPSLLLMRSERAG